MLSFLVTTENKEDVGANVSVENVHTSNHKAHQYIEQQYGRDKFVVVSKDRNRAYQVLKLVDGGLVETLKVGGLELTDADRLASRKAIHQWLKEKADSSEAAVKESSLKLEKPDIDWVKAILKDLAEELESGRTLSDLAVKRVVSALNQLDTAPADQ